MTDWARMELLLLLEEEKVSSRTPPVEEGEAFDDGEYGGWCS